MSLPQPTAGGAPCLRRGALAAFLVLAVAPLAACAAGNDAQTLSIRPDNAATTVGDIEIKNAVVIVAEEDDTLAAVSATLFNNGSDDQTLDSVTIEGGHGPLRLAAAGGKGSTITVPAGGSVLLGGKGNPSVTLVGASGAQSPSIGGYDKVTFDFSETGEVALEANVVAPHSYYADFGPTPQATASAPPSGSASPSGRKSPKSAGESEGATGTEQTGRGDEGSATSKAPASPNATPSGSADAQAARARTHAR